MLWGWVKKICPLGLALFLLPGCFLDLERSIAPSPGGQWQPPAEAIFGADRNAAEALSIQPAEEPFGTAKDLSALLDEALLNSPVVQKAWHTARVAAARKVQSYGAFFPEISLGQNVQRQQIDAIGVPGGGQGFVLAVPEGNVRTTRVSYGPLLDIKYTIFSFGADSARAAAAREALYAANYSYNRSLQEVVFRVEQAYYALHAAEAAVSAREASYRDAEASYAAAKTRSEVGLSPIQDLLKARSNLLEAQYQLEFARAAVENGQALLARAIGRSNLAGIKIVSPPSPDTSRQFVGDISELTAQAINRPDLQSALAAQRSSRRAKEAAGLDLMPRLVGGFSGDLTKIDGASGREENYIAYLRMQWDIFDGFRKEYRAAEANAIYEAAKQDARAAHIAAVSEIWAAYHDFESSKAMLESARALISAAQSTFQAIETGYNNGLNSLLDLLSSQQDLANARLFVVRSEADFYLSLARLVYALGAMPEEIKSVG